MMNFNERLRRNMEEKGPEAVKKWASQLNSIKGVYIAELIYQWADNNRMHPDDFSMLFAEELLEKLEADN
jgi:two-component SAPR family response regulator